MQPQFIVFTRIFELYFLHDFGESPFAAAPVATATAIKKGKKQKAEKADSVEEGGSRKKRKVQ